MQKKEWIKRRHSIVRNLLAMPVHLYSILKYGISIEKFKTQEKRPYLILYNHQTAFDQFFVGLSMKYPVYYLASEDLFSKGWVSSLIRFLVEPIPIKKQTLDITAVKTCLRVAKEGGTIAIAPEGNRTFSGKTEYINPSIASLAKKLNLPIALFKIEGGYGVHPRWSDVVRKGKMRAYVSEVIMPEEYEQMSKEELFERINSGLYVDEANSKNSFYHKKRAEYLERAIYICPDCGLSVFESCGNTVKCKKCGKTVEYGENTELKSKGFEFPFSFVSQWYDYQKEFINKLDLTDYIETPLYREETSLSEVMVYKRKIPMINNAKITLYGDRIIINESEDGRMDFPFDKVSAVTILGKNKLNIYYDGKIYQLKSGKRFNALKYVHIFNHYQNVRRGVLSGEFLGL